MSTSNTQKQKSAKLQVDSKELVIKGRKRKPAEVEDDWSKPVKKMKFCKDGEVSKHDEDDYEEKQVVVRYLSDKAVRNYEMISEFMNEFNCNSHEMEIYLREWEKGQIKEYIEENMGLAKSGLMYVWGHPGTGKSSIIRVILKDFEEKLKDSPDLK